MLLLAVVMALVEGLSSTLPRTLSHLHYHYHRRHHYCCRHYCCRRRRRRRHRLVS